MAGNGVTVEAELSEDNIASEPVGRRLFLGGMVLGVAGIAFGRSIQDFLQSVAESDPTGALDSLRGQISHLLSVRHGPGHS